MKITLVKRLHRLIKGNNPTVLLAFNAAIIAMMMLMPLAVKFGWGWLAGTVFVYFCNICLGVSLTYHRSLTHYALRMPKWLERTFVSFACASGTGSPIMWVMTHRQHHRFADKPGDPHPPGAVWKTFFGVYPSVTGHIKDIARDPFYRFWHKNYFGLLMLWGAVLGLVGGVQAFYFLYLLPVFGSIVVSNALNWFGHEYSDISYRNYDLKDKSQNNWMMAVFAFGEGWHNNHHRYPTSAKFGVRWFELDISYAVARLLQSVGLATNVRTHKESI